MNNEESDIEIEVIKTIKQHFHSVWESCDRKAAYELTNEILSKIGFPILTSDEFDHRWQFTTIFHEDYIVARNELRILVFNYI